jgi:two-component system sensor histidine kinase NreB
MTELTSEIRWFRGLLAHVSEGAFLLDRDGRFLYANPAASRLFRSPASVLVGQPLTALVHPDDRVTIAECVAKVASNEQTFATTTCRARTPGDGYAWLEFKLRHEAEAGAIVCTCLDVTLMRRARETRGASTGTPTERDERLVDKLWLAIEQTADCVMITDRDGVIEYVNPAFEILTGYSRDDAIGHTPQLVRSGLQPARFYEALWNTILAGRTFRSTMTNRRRDGTLYDEDQTITPIRDESGTVTHFVSTGRDITQRNRMQEALRRLNHQLEREATRIAGALHDEAGQFLTSAHITLADVARDAESPVRERLNEVRRHLDQVEERLRRVAQEIHPRVVEDLGLGDAVGFLAESFTRRTGVRVTVECSLLTRYPLGVETLLYRLVQEALTNVSRHAKATKALVTLSADDETVTCSIRDDGVGFDPGILLQRADGHLGLRVMQDRLDAVGGTLAIVSMPNQGTELKVTVPVEV